MNVHGLLLTVAISGAAVGQQADTVRVDPPTGERDADRASLLAALEEGGGHGTVRHLTFELSRLGLMLGCCATEGRFRQSGGGYRIESNTFRASVNGVRTVLSSAEPIVIRENRFIDTFHAISAADSHIHFLDHDVSAPPSVARPGPRASELRRRLRVAPARVRRPDGARAVRDGRRPRESRGEVSPRRTGGGGR